MKRISRRNFLKAAGVGAAALSLAACGGAASSTAPSTASSAASAAAEDVTIKVAAIETGYGAEMWKKVTEPEMYLWLMLRLKLGNLLF